MPADGDQVFADRKPLRIERHHVARVFGETDHRIERDPAVFEEKTNQHVPVVVPFDIGFDARCRPLIDPAGDRTAEIGREDRMRDFMRDDRVENPLFGPLNRHLPAGDIPADESERRFASGAHIGPRLDLDRTRGGPGGKLHSEPEPGEPDAALLGALRHTVGQIGAGGGHHKVFGFADRRGGKIPPSGKKEEQKRGTEYKR